MKVFMVLSYYKLESTMTKLLHTKLQRLNYYKFESTRTKLLQIKVKGLECYFHEKFGDQE